MPYGFGYGPLLGGLPPDGGPSPLMAPLPLQGGLGGAVDPALMGALAAQPDPMAGALAAAPGKRPSVVLDVGAGGANAPGGPAPPAVRVGLGGGIDLTPQPAASAGPLPALTPDQAAKGFGGGGRGAGGYVELSPGQQAPMAFGGTPGGLSSGSTDLRVLQAQADAAKAKDAQAAAAGGIAPGAAVAAPQAGAGAGGADPLGHLNPYERQRVEWIEAEKQRELSKRASAGTLLRGGRVPTGEQYQAPVGPDAASLAAYQQRRGEGADLAKAQAGVDAEIAQKQAQAGARAVGIEAQAQARLERIAAARDEALSQHRERVAALAQQVQDGEIDPDRLWRNASEGRKGAFLVAAALSGVGAALSGRPGAPNPAIEGLMRAMDRDNEAQKLKLADKRSKLNAAQEVYKFMLDSYGDEAAATSAMKVARLEALKRQFEAEAELQRSRSTTTVKTVGPDGQTYETSPINLRLAQNLNAIDQKIATEDMALSERLNGAVSKSFGFTQDRYVGGSSGPSAKRLAELSGEQGELVRKAQPKAGEQSALLVGGQPLATHPGASSATIDLAQKRVNFADDVLGIVAQVRSDKKAGRYFPSDPVRKMSALGLANGVAQMGGGGVGSESDKADAAAALDPKDPRHDDALDRIEAMAKSAKANAIRSVGAK